MRRLQCTEFGLHFNGTVQLSSIGESMVDVLEHLWRVCLCLSRPDLGEEFFHPVKFAFREQLVELVRNIPGPLDTAQ